MDVRCHLQAEQSRGGPEEDTLRGYELSCGDLLGMGTGFEFANRKSLQILLSSITGGDLFSGTSRLSALDYHEPRHI